MATETTEIDLRSTLAVGTDATAPVGDPLLVAGSADQTAPRHQTALTLDQWGLDRGEELLAENPRISEAKLGKEPALAVADFHAAAFEPDPTLNPDCVDERRREFMSSLIETPAYKELHEQTRLNLLGSAIAATAFAEQFATLLKEDQRNDRPGDKPGQGERRMEVAAARAAGQAAQKAAKDVEQANEAGQAFGIGGGQQIQSAEMAKAAAGLFLRVRNSDFLKRVAELAGRFRRLGMSKQRQKARHGYDDMIGVVLDGDPGRLLPQELAALGDPELELDVLRRIAERQAMCREYRGTEPVAKGPVVVLVDESSSMNGSKIEAAKALALAIVWIARKQRRWSALVGFSSRNHVRSLALPPARWDEAAVVTWVESFLGGGTEPPLAGMPAIYAETKAPVGKTDVILITDGCFGLEQEEHDGFLAWKIQAKAKMTSLVIGADAKGGRVEDVSDRVHYLAGIDVSEAGVGQVLSF